MGDRRYTYIASDNTATNGTALGTDNTDVVVFRILIGNPTNAATVTLYDKTNPISGATTSVAYKLTQPTAAAGKDWVREVNFGDKGIHLGEGGNVVTTENDVTVVWGLS